jgi:hypothetical protein
MNFVEQEMESMFGADSGSSDDDETPCSTTADGDTMHMPPTQLVSVRSMDVGGGRGVFANGDLPAGFLVLSEIPVVTWPDECSDLEDHANLLRALYLLCTNRDAFEVSTHLHPLVLGDADADEIAAAREILSEDVDNSILEDSAKTTEDALRVLLTLQHNGFVSGLYQNLSLVNHSCNPNCIKFAPTASSLHASEIWTTRPVLAGEEITICYCSPLETTRRSMLNFLKTHHRFDCTCSQCLSISPSPSPSAAVTSTGVIGQKSSLNELFIAEIAQNFQDLLETMESELKWGHVKDATINLKTYMSMIGTVKKAIMEFQHDIKAAIIKDCESGDIDLALTELISYQQLMARSSKIGISASIACIRAVDVIENQEVTSGSKLSLPYGQRTCVKHSEGVDSAAVCSASTVDTRTSAGRQRQPVIQWCAEAYLRYGLGCLASQLTYLGADHADLATTNAEAATALDLLLTTCTTIPELHTSACILLPYWKPFELIGNSALRIAVRALCDSLAPVSSADTTGDVITNSTPAASKFESFVRSEGKAKMKAVHREFDREGKRLRSLYSVHLRYPETIRAHSEFEFCRRQRDSGAVAGAGGDGDKGGNAGSTLSAAPVSSCYWGSRII